MEDIAAWPGAKECSVVKEVPVGSKGREESTAGTWCSGLSVRMVVSAVAVKSAGVVLPSSSPSATVVVTSSSWWEAETEG